MLDEINIPNSVTHIGSGAFSFCVALKEINLPDSITSINEYTFSSCRRLEKCTIGPLVKDVGSDVFSYCVSLKTLTIPGNVETIDFKTGINSDHSIFYGCDELQEIKFLYGELPLTGVSLLSDCRITLYEGDRYNIYDIKCVPLKSLFIDRMITWAWWIYWMPAFKGIKDLTLGAHVTNYMDLEIRNMDDLESITSYSIKPPKIGSCTNSQYLNVVVKVPNDALEAYRNADVWKNFWTIEGFDPSGVDSIDSESPEKFEIGRYDINGREVSQDYEGIVIIKYSDGSAKKIISHKI